MCQPVYLLRRSCTLTHQLFCMVHGALEPSERPAHRALTLGPSQARAWSELGASSASLGPGPCLDRAWPELGPSLARACPELQSCPELAPSLARAWPVGPGHSGLPRGLSDTTDISAHRLLRRGGPPSGPRHQWAPLVINTLAKLSTSCSATEGRHYAARFEAAAAASLGTESAVQLGKRQFCRGRGPSSTRAIAAMP